MLLYATLLVTGLAGMLHLSWWAAVCGACVLSLVLVFEKSSPSLRPTGLQSATLEAASIISSLLISPVASAAAFAAGRASAWLWGI